MANGLVFHRPSSFLLISAIIAPSSFIKMSLFIAATIHNNNTASPKKSNQLQAQGYIGCWLLHQNIYRGRLKIDKQAKFRLPTPDTNQ